MVKGLPTFKRETAKCEACIMGKQKRDPFPTSTWRANKCLQLIHSDICGPMESSFGGCRYFLLFIDDCTRMTWVYFLKAKSEAFEKIIHFKHLVENSTKERIATLRTDNGGEFTSNEFNDYCRNNGIKMQLTNSYTPQQNGVTERMNQTLMVMARSMLHFKGLSTKYWAEAVHTTIYLRNRSPTSALDGITPYEAWYGTKPSINHLRIFCSTCYALVPKEQRTKLENRSMKCMLLGYSNEKKGYRLISNGKFIISRDVVFHETESQTTEEIDHLLNHLENKVTQGKTVHQDKLSWTAKDLAPNMDAEELDNSSLMKILPLAHL